MGSERLQSRNWMTVTVPKRMQIFIFSFLRIGNLSKRESTVKEKRRQCLNLERTVWLGEDEE